MGNQFFLTASIDRKICNFYESLDISSPYNLLLDLKHAEISTSKFPPFTLPLCFSLGLSLIFIISLFNPTLELYGIDSSSTDNETSILVGAQFPLNILNGAALQGNPAFDPSTLTVIPGSTIEVFNLDTVPHTVTSGKGPSDRESGNAFDTGIIDMGDISYINTSDSNVGVSDYPFYCSIHPYMKGRLIVVNEIDTTSSFTSSS